MEGQRVQELYAEADRIRERFPDDGYVAFHAPRYAMLIDLLHEAVAQRPPGVRVLDIGNSPFTELSAERLGPVAADESVGAIDNLGLHGEFETPFGQSYWYDLNHAGERDRWRDDLPSYDVIVFAEVIEHLHTAPQLVLRFLRSLLAADGHLIVQTPNAAALHNRLQLLAGRNPFEMIREETNDPGHFREYTRRELHLLADQAGFTVERWTAHSYFDYRFDEASRRPLLGRLVNRLYTVLPPTLRPGQTVVLRPAARG